MVNHVLRRFENDICIPNTDQDVCILKHITYLHEMSLHLYRPRFLQLGMTRHKKSRCVHTGFPILIVGVFTNSNYLFKWAFSGLPNTLCL